MRIVHPVTSRPLAIVIPRQSAKPMRSPSLLPTVYPTQPTPIRRLLRVLGFGF